VRGVLLVLVELGFRHHRRRQYPGLANRIVVLLSSSGQIEGQTQFPQETGEVHHTTLVQERDLGAQLEGMIDGHHVASLATGYVDEVH